MFIIYGIKRKIKVDADMGAQVCPNCSHPSRLVLAREKVSPHIFYIPLGSFTKRRMVFCANCGIVEEMDHYRFKDLTAQYKLTAGQQ